jgi:hypothetical protein
MKDVVNAFQCVPQLILIEERTFDIFNIVAGSPEGASSGNRGP